MQRISSLLALVAISSVLVGCVSCTGFYTIVAPSHIRPHSDYQVSITLHDNVQSTKIRLGIEDGQEYKNQQEVTVNSNHTEFVKLQIDALNVTKGYKFVAEGLSGLTFREESNLKVISKNVSIFIQTDKAIYKPGETIKFRVLVLDNELKPAVLKPDGMLNIYLTDPEKNRIKQWLKVNLKKGVFTSDIQLSELPVLGNWKLEAEVENEKKIKEVEVAEYVLPKFEVTIDSPNDFSAKDGKIKAIIRSKYTYGKMLKGEAIVSLTQKPSYSYYSYRDDSNKNSIIKTIPINGKGTAEFDVEELKVEFDQYQSSKNFELKATVIEELTHRNQSATKAITVHQNRYRFTTTDLNYEYTPGVPMSFKVGITNQDNSPVLLNEETKWLMVGKIIDRGSTNENVTYYKFELNSNGTADVKIPTRRTETGIFLQIKYMDEEHDLRYFHPLTVSEPSELEAKILTKRPLLNEDLFVEVQSSHELKNFTYQVIGHGKIIHAENVAVPDRRYHVFKFKVTFDLVPKATIIVYRFKDGEIVAAKTEVTIEEDLNNFVKLRLSATETQPGKDVNIDVNTKPDSYVGLVGVDQSVLLLKKNYGFEQSDAMSELQSYQHHTHWVENGPWTVEHRYYTNDYFRPFDYSDLILFTNAKKDIYRPVNRVFAYSHKKFATTTSSQVHYSALAAAGPPGMPSQYDMESAVLDRGGALGGAPHVEPPRVRTEFPETWLWEDVDVNSPNGTLTITKKVPDTITSWVISAFSVNSQYGLGLMKHPKSLNVFQPFFVSLNLPYSVKRGEVVAVPVILFNYMDTDIVADVTLSNEQGEFQFVDDVQDQVQRKRQVRVAANSGASSTFIVRFTSVGQIPLNVKATSAVAGDAIVRILQVDPEGVPQFVNKALFVDLREKTAFDAVQNVEVPDNAVPGSLKINVNAIGDLLGGAIQNLHQLIRLPTGCGEQNMLKFVPNVVVLDYLKAAGSLSPEIKDKAIKYLLKGYQRELTYRHLDGSFSSFGKLDRKGSTWLTAFVAKSFKQAEQYIDIDANIVEKALEWLSKIQAADGSFPELGQISHAAMQGGSNKGVALTAYTVIAFLKNEVDGWKYAGTVEKAVNNIAANINGIESPYVLAVAAYALQLADHPTKDQVLNNLVAKSVATDQHKWWTNTKPGPNARQSKSIDVEITSYGLLALIKAQRFEEALPYFKWLLAQRNDKGGFVGTQDTVIGLESLATYGQFLTSKDNNVQLKVETETIKNRKLDVMATNALVLQTIDLPSESKSVHMSASGHGFALFQLSYRYNLNQSDVYSTFNLTPKLLETTAGHLNVEVCARFNPKTPDELHSNMVIVEVSMPSGFLVEKDSFTNLLHVPHVKLVESQRGDTVADIYIDQMQANEEMCLQVQGYRSHKVAENKPVPVRIYDYYDSSRSAREFYEIPSITSCEICEGDECPRSCHH